MVCIREMLKTAFLSLVVSSVAYVKLGDPYLHFAINGRTFRPSYERRKKRDEEMLALIRECKQKGIEENSTASANDEEMFRGRTRRQRLKGLLRQSIVRSRNDVMADVTVPAIMSAMERVITPFGFSIDRALVKKEEDDITRASLVAGDVYTYKTFARVFNPVLGIKSPSIQHEMYPFSFDASQAYLECAVDPCIVKSVHFHMQRSLAEYRFLPACKLKERRNVKHSLLRSFKFLPHQHKGGFLSINERYRGPAGFLAAPFHFKTLAQNPWPAGLLSYSLLPNDKNMKMNVCNKSKVICHIGPEHLSQRPDTDLCFAAGINRDWPDGRGIYVSNDKNTLLTINRDSHLGIYHAKQGGEVSQGFKEFCEIYRGICRGLQRDNLHFAYDEKYGFVTWDTNRVGDSLTISAKIRVPHLEKHEKFAALLLDCGFQCRRIDGDEGHFEVFVPSQFGQSALEMIDTMSSGLRRMVEIEQMIERNDLNELDMPSEYSGRKASRNMELIFGSEKEINID